MPAGTVASSGSLSHWAQAYVESQSLRYKLYPPPPPVLSDADSVRLRLAAPGRPPELRPTEARQKKISAPALRAPRARAQLLHIFFHHELQAAELMCWAFLAFADAEPEFRRGLVGICLDEIRHMNMYRAHIEELGFQLGDFPVRDWFWQRVPTCREKHNFVAMMGLGLEAANLEHATKYARWFRMAGDERGARVQDQVGREEIAHVAFGRRWFEQWTGSLDFEAWRSALPPPLSPMLMRGTPLNVEARTQAGIPQQFIETLGAWVPE